MPTRMAMQNRVTLCSLEGEGRGGGGREGGRGENVNNRTNLLRPSLL